MKPIVLVLVSFLPQILTKKALVCGTFNSRSHLRAAVLTGISLHDAGHDVKVLGPDTVIDIADNLGASHLPRIQAGSYNLYESLGATDIFDDVWEVESSNDISTVKILAKFTQVMNTMYYAETLATMSASMREEKPDVILADIFSFPCLEAAERLGIPVVGTVAVFMHGALNLATPTWLNSDGLTTTQDYRPITSENESMVSRLKGIPRFVRTWWHFGNAFREISRYRVANGLDPESWMQRGSDFAAVLVSSFEPFETPLERPTHVVLTGPMALEAPAGVNISKELETFLNARNGVIYLALGQHTHLSKGAKDAAYSILRKVMDDGLADGVVWVTRDDTQWSDSLRDKRFHFVKWTSQHEVLNHPATKLFISHCGGDSSLEGMIAGVPILGLPVGWDQIGNAQKLQEIGMAEWITIQDVKLYADRFDRYVRSLLTNASYSKQAIATGRIAVAHAKVSRGKSVAVLETIFGLGPDALKDRARRIGWAKRNDYDLYAIFACLVVVLMWTVKKLEIFNMVTQLSRKPTAEAGKKVM